jgi:hypothetical protein
MNLLTKKVLTKDFMTANRLMDFLVPCSERHDEALEVGNLVKARTWQEEQRRALDELEVLFKKKEEQERVAALMHDLRIRNININIINLTI